MNHFPEIATFFKRQQFDGADLFELISTIDKTYLDHKLNIKAKSLVKLELLKFELISEEVLTKQIKTKHGNLAPKKSVTSQEKVIHERKTSHSRSDKRSYFISRKVKSILEGNYRNAAKELEYTSVFILKMLKKKGFASVRQFDKVSKEVYSVMEPFVLHRLKMNYEHKYGSKGKKGLETKHLSKRSASPSPGVYGRIEKQGGLGKIIYIRSK